MAVPHQPGGLYRSLETVILSLDAASRRIKILWPEIRVDLTSKLVAIIHDSAKIIVDGAPADLEKLNLGTAHIAGELTTDENGNRGFIVNLIRQSSDD